MSSRLRAPSALVRGKSGVNRAALAFVANALFVLGAAVPTAEAQTGECLAGGCALSASQYPLTLQATTSTSFVTVATDIFAGEWAQYGVAAGRTYEWTLCSADGASVSYDATMTLRTDASPGALLCSSDDASGCQTSGGQLLAPKIRWTATFSGAVRLQVNQYISLDPCGTNSTNTHLRWRCVDCGGPVVATIFDAWWTGEDDHDGDGCNRSGTLNWDPDVAGCVGTLSVFERIYWKPAASATWTLLHTTAPHSITGCPPTDVQSLPFTFSSACGSFDWAIEINRVGQPLPDDTRYAANDSELNDHPEESVSDDNLPPNKGDDLSQRRADTDAVIPSGGTVPFGTGVYFGVTVSDPNPGDTVRLEIELRQLPATFTGTANYVSPFVASGTVAITSTATGLAPGNYGWRCRVVDNYGAASNWLPEENPDFIVAAPDIRVQPSSVTLGCLGAVVVAARTTTPDVFPFAMPHLELPVDGRERKLLHAPEILQPLDAGANRNGVIVNLRRDERAVINWDDVDALAVHQAAVAALQDAVLAAVPMNEITIMHLYENLWGFSADVTPAGLLVLQDHPDVAVIEPIRLLHAQGAQGIPLMNGMSFRNTYNGSGMAIAICDTGIDYTHPRLGGGGFPNSKVIGGFDFGNNDANPIAFGDAHGTACAGISAGALGTVGDYIGGVAHSAKLYALKMSPDNSDSASTSAMIASWDWCVTHRNDDPMNPLSVISTSFGGGQFFSACDGESPMMTSAAAVAVSAGITVFASSGNDGFCDAIGWPACISHVVSVGAVYDADIGVSIPCVSGLSCAPGVFPTGGCPSGFAALESTSADQVTVYSNAASFLALLAPSNNASTSDITGAAGYSFDDYTTTFGGTSAACPYAAGAAAALQSAAKSVTGSFLTPANVKSILTSTGVNRTDSKSGITKPRIDLGAAINSLGPPSGSACFTIFNDGTATLNVASVTKPVWATLVPAAPFPIPAGGSLLVCVQACTACAGSDLDGDLSIFSDDPDTPSMNVAIHVDCSVSCPGDANQDGVVNFDDVLSVLGNYGANYGSGTGPGDSDGSGIVNFSDILTVLANFGAVCP